MNVRRESSVVSDAQPLSATTPRPPPSLDFLRQPPRDNAFKTPYVFCRAMRDFAYWDCHFHVKLMNGLTLSQLEEPPTRVLAVGEGSDYWAVKAAQAWPNAQIFCHDLSRSSDNFKRTLPYLKVEGRVLFENFESFDSLPYPDNYFNLVVSRYMSLLVPEREWAKAITEILRVTVPGGLFEALVNDFVFPGARISKTPVPYLSTTTLHSPPLYSPTSTTASTSSFNPLFVSTDQLSPQSPSVETPNSSLRIRVDSQDSYPFPTSPCHDDLNANLPDHSRLAVAWEEMLSARGISQRTTSVFPFYLTALSDKFRVLPALEVYMPSPTSELSPNGGEPGLTNGSIKQTQVKFGDESDGQSVASTDSAISELIASSAPMHLARAVQFVRCCREALWEAYEALYTQEADVTGMRVIKVAKGDLVTVGGPQESRRQQTREQFEHDWANWEADMKGRVGMRDHMQASLGWSEPLSETPSDGRARNDLQARLSALSLEHQQSNGAKEEVCRTLRYFIVHKPKVTNEG